MVGNAIALKPGSQIGEADILFQVDADMVGLTCAVGHIDSPWEAGTDRDPEIRKIERDFNDYCVLCFPGARILPLAGNHVNVRLLSFWSHRRTARLTGFVPLATIVDVPLPIVAGRQVQFSVAHSNPA